MTILEEPDACSPVLNPVAYQFSSTAETAIVKLEMESELFLGDFTEIAQLDAPLDADNLVTFRLERLLESQLQYSSPATDQATAFRPKQLCLRYRIQYAEFNTGDLIENLVFTEHVTKYAFLGGFPFQEYPDRATTLPVTGKLLQHLPADRQIGMGQAHWLNFISENAETLDFVFTVFYTDNSIKQVNASFGTAQAYEPVLLPVGFDAHDYNEPGKTVFRISLGELGVTLYPLDTTYWPDPHEFHFWTRKGAFESLLCTGLHQDTAEDESLSFELETPTGYATGQALARHYYQDRTEGGTVNTGYFLNRDSFNAAREIFRKLDAFKRVGGAYLPVNIQEDSHKGLDNRDPLQGFSFHYQYAFPG